MPEATSQVICDDQRKSTELLQLELSVSKLTRNYLHCCTFLEFMLDLKDIHREKASSIKSPVLTKTMNMDIYVVDTSNQLFIGGFDTDVKLYNKVKKIK